MSIADSMGAVNTSNQDQNQKTDRILRALAQDTGRPNQQNNMNRTELRAKQDQVIGIADRLKMNPDAPISDIQNGAPTINQLRTALYPDFTVSLDSFLISFDQGE